MLFFIIAGSLIFIGFYFLLKSKSGDDSNWLSDNDFINDEKSSDNDIEDIDKEIEDWVNKQNLIQSQKKNTVVSYIPPSYNIDEYHILGLCVNCYSLFSTNLEKNCSKCNHSDIALGVNNKVFIGKWCETTNSWQLLKDSGSPLIYINKIH